MTVFQRTSNIPFTACVTKTYKDGDTSDGIIRGTWYNVKSVASSPRFEESVDVSPYDCFNGGGFNQIGVESVDQ